jgi:hypothetical protein
MRLLKTRLLTTAGIGVLSLLLGIPAVSAQDDKPKSDEARPEASPEAAKPPKQDQDKQEMKDQNNLPNDRQNNDKQTKEENKQDKDAAKAAKENGGTPANAHPASGQSGNGHPGNGQSARIPDKDFKAHFGKQHTFVVNRPTVVEGQPRFQYGGYWFVISDPWPTGWAYTDSCYIDYIDGEYFLFDLLHPGVQIALVVVVA